MAKAKLNELLKEVRGSIGKLTLKQTPHGPVLTSKPETPKEWSGKQQEHRKRLSMEARLFYRREMADPAKAAHYRGRARQENIPVSSFVMGGFMKHGAGFSDLEAPHSAPGGQMPGRDGDDSD